MIQQKKKLCSGCDSLQYIWKNQDGGKYCRDCAKSTGVANSGKSKPKSKQKPIPLRSSKKAKLDAAYSILRLTYLKQYPTCQAQLPGCKTKAIDIHHVYSGSNRSSHYLDTLEWKSVCRDCHSYIHDKLSSEEAIALGLKKI